MNEKTRVRLLLGIFILLIGANVYYRLGDNSLDGAFWNEEVALDGNLPASLARKVEEIRQSPRLSFRDRHQALEKPNITRNPFIFGIDRRAEAAQEQRMQALQTAREETLKQMAEVAEAQAMEEKQEPAFDGEVIGIFENLETGVRKAAIRTDVGLQTVGKGDLLNRRYRVVRVAYGYVALYDLKEKKEIRLDVAP